MDQARLLFADYCYYRGHTAHVQNLKQARPYLRDLKETPARLKLFARMAKWCEDQGFNPREWLYSLFVSRRWLFCPKMEPAHLQSVKHIPRYQALDDFGLYRQRLMELESMAAPSASTYDPNRDLSHTAEETKAAYHRAGQYDQCMAGLFTSTFGYHPKSAACARCPVSGPCCDQLVRSVDFDILALRRGEITSEAARAQALSRVQRYAK